MSERVLDRVAELADQFRPSRSRPRLGELPEATVKAMKSIGSIRLLRAGPPPGGWKSIPRELRE